MKSGEEFVASYLRAVAARIDAADSDLLIAWEAACVLKSLEGKNLMRAIQDARYRLRKARDGLARAVK